MEEVNQPIRIAMLLDGRYPQDIRVRKEAESLAKAGIHVTVICPHREGLSAEEEVKGVKILRIGKNFDHTAKGIQDIIVSMTWRHPLFKKGLKEILKNHDYDFLHVHDLPLAQTALDFRDRAGIKVVLDLHENYPEGIKSWFRWQKSFLKNLKNRIFFNYDHWLKYEGRMANQADVVIAVVEEMKDRLIQLHSVEASKIRIIGNTEPHQLDQSTEDSPIDPAFDGKTLITYVGQISPERGVQHAIQAMPKIIASAPEAHLVILGPAADAVMSHLKELRTQLSMEGHITFLGRQPFATAMSYIKRSEINIVPHLFSDHTDNTIPHKLFQIMTLGRPLLVSSCRPLKRVVETCKAGRVFKADDPLSFAENALEMIDNYDQVLLEASQVPERLKELKMTWEDDAKNLVSLYSELSAES